MDEQDTESGSLEDAFDASKVAAALEGKFPGFRRGMAQVRTAEVARSRANRQRAELLRRARKSRGLKQEDLADGIGLKQSSISRLERMEDVSPTIGSVSDFLAGCGYQLELRAIPFEQLADANSSRNKAPIDLVGILDNLGILYLETDENDVISASNTTWRRLHDPISKHTHGVAYADFLSAGLKEGLFPGAKNDPDWAERRLFLHNEPQGAFEIERQDNCLLQVIEMRKPQGGIITISKDISFKKAMLPFVNGDTATI